ncbi:VanZ family protein [Cellulomonas fimi]|uniref:VanZ family protein n=1 Tax=Cellulomonas fimi TaxID=1708 RepID=UPI00234C750B|nr:VanZ family protein [Cellulomonas fimi]MDC7121632.1 VanZ family protein [Cellulomonas fimi]
MPSSPAARRRVLVAVLVVYLAGVARLTLWPEPAPDATFGLVRAVLAWLQDRGLPVTYAGTEAVANVALFVPFGLLVGVLLRHPWWAVALGAATSAAIETAQLAFLPSRVPTVQDVVMNTLGTALGVAALLVARRVAQKRTGQALPEEDPARTAG